MSDLPDRRVNAYRTDLADIRLKGRVDAARYVEGSRRRVAVPVAPLRRTPAADAPRDTELLFGENVRVFDEADGWCWVQNSTDSYVGYMESTALDSTLMETTDKVAVPGTFVYAEPDLKSPVQARLSMGSGLSVIGNRGAYVELATGGFVFSRHIANIRAPADDHVEAALSFLGVPYLWGGRSSLGLDCSGLVQIVLDLCGTAAPRDTDMQAKAIGYAIAFSGNMATLQRGDLVFWPGHVGIQIDNHRFIHANATDMAVTMAPLKLIAARIEAETGDTITTVRRP